MYYKSGQAGVTHLDCIVLLQIRANFVKNWGSFIITYWGKSCYNLGAAISNWGKIYYKWGHNRYLKS